MVLKRGGIWTLFEVSWAVATPEFSGTIEPTPLIGKTQILDPDTGRRLMVHDTIDETVDHFIPRLKKWVVLQRKPNSEKKVAILYLIGVEPVWDAMGRVKGRRVIPGSRLGRPRIDVLINPSGLYRDVFPDKLIFLDEAVQKAMVQTDIENLLAKNKAIIKKALMDAGIGEKEAETQSRFRIFTEKVGSYIKKQLRFADRYALRKSQLVCYVK
ncbi:cobaltochelatase subunit CobN [Desulfosarcina ovata]|uniref:CobN/magnesium chelatase domain-containing protein n=1 Tax=Desulfosarcina ovata subsp. ovata TaxID=2752305 RepID=A0A5K8AIS6_9BACT|nr:cobaltochelatase subunit CobN [Desulfosarcina ovata]BBO92468.1 hypothetical protein DSCOOX_56480 [Desulfosarcina ovata subsp. ovata]